MIRSTGQLLEDLNFDESKEWTQLTSIFGSPAIPSESAEVIANALKKMMDEGNVGHKNKWQAIEYWAADYLAGK